MKKKRYRSPLIFDADKFSKKCKIPKTLEIKPTLTGFILKSLYIYFLLAIDMILFASSGNLIIFSGILPSAEIFILLFVLLAFSFAIVGCAYKKPIIQNIICCIFTLWFIVVFFNQFYQLDENKVLGDFVSIYLGSWTPKFLFSYSHVVLAILLSSLLGFLIFKYNEKCMLCCVSILFLVFFIMICSEGANDKPNHDFIELYNSQTTTVIPENTSDNKFIYIMLPNLSSYKYFSRIDDVAAKNTHDLILGFYAKNNFEVFPNTFIEYLDQFMNVVQSVNSFSNTDPDTHILDTMLLYKYWSFFNVNDEYIFLKNNQMFDSFKKAGYKISAYKSRGIDICHKNHVFNVNRCMEKINKPVNLYDAEMSAFDRSQLLFTEWLSSMEIFNLEPIYHLLNIFSKPEKLPLIGINYNNLYVINSIKTFDILAEHILSDNGRQAYFVYADIPSDMFIYDEFCNIKPREKWISMDDLPWVNADNSTLKRNAYIDQTKCLYGKLQEFIDKLNEKHILDDSVMIINGMSSTHDFRKKAFDKVVDNFLYDKIISLAIKSPSITEFNINNNICSSKSIVHNVLFNANNEVCSNVENIGIRGSFKDAILEALIDNNDENLNIEDNIDKFDFWYYKWKQFNIINDEFIDIFKKEKLIPFSNIDDEAPSIGNVTLQ